VKANLAPEQLTPKFIQSLPGGSSWFLGIPLPEPVCNWKHCTAEQLEVRNTARTPAHITLLSPRPWSEPPPVPTLSTLLANTTPLQIELSQLACWDNLLVALFEKSQLSKLHRELIYLPGVTLGYSQWEDDAYTPHTVLGSAAAISPNSSHLSTPPFPTTVATMVAIYSKVPGTTYQPLISLPLSPVTS
jgi:hypothetical protein